jgi:hypothetical protein
MIGLLLLGFPMMVPLLAASWVTFVFFFPSLDPAILVQQRIGGIKPAALIAVPMFIFAADIMLKGQAANRLLEVVTAFQGEGRDGPIDMLFIEIPRKKTSDITLFTREIDPKCFYIIEDVREASLSAITLHQPTGWRAILKKK